MATYYANGAPSDWRDTLSAPMHRLIPHEDWAESFAHYLHIYDTLETAKERNLTDASVWILPRDFDAWIAGTGSNCLSI